ncbi:cytochrome b/b6 domain-containing protein [Candidatus Formimonas warabiya]|uniref:4Fe-4S ferredoxin-type domain-containing protein n=1 Tax=Formimonas warabiya TaxID=1761012 RepID=A0A3G1KR85_FORW1|nr:cytochrome b/b6 domain-containing protein [Candidatus Formimonas warabiya]ATW24971.1 hypothetical protein DCMF_09470 [Candidatus Formimonas warabiya]
MGTYWALKQNYRILQTILDENLPPVGRFRLLSQGLSSAHCLPECEHAIGDRACMACGNCVDACPQVLRKYQALDASNNRTSMFLEQAVGESCIRCYSCIGSCPQVDKQLKNFAVRFRLAEKMVHWFLVLCYFGLAATGIGLNHFRSDWSGSFVLIMALLHRIFALGFLSTPFIFYLFDRHHLKRILRNVFSFGPKDLLWLKDAYRYLTGKDRHSLFQGDFNSGQKCWYLIVIGSFFVLGLTGAAKFTTFGVTPGLKSITVIHIVWAVIMDVTFVTHLYRKLVSRNLIRFRLYTNHKFALTFPEEERKSEPAYAVQTVSPLIDQGGSAKA